MNAVILNILAVLLTIVYANRSFAQETFVKVTIAGSIEDSIPSGVIVLNSDSGRIMEQLESTFISRSNFLCAGHICRPKESYLNLKKFCYVGQAEDACIILENSMQFGHPSHESLRSLRCDSTSVDLKLDYVLNNDYDYDQYIYHRLIAECQSPL